MKLSFVGYIRNILKPNKLNQNDLISNKVFVSKNDENAIISSYEISKEEANRIMSDVPENKTFIVKNGMILKNLYDLQTAISLMSDEVYTYHANEQKNDFITWINDIQKDYALVESLKKARSKEEFLSRLSSRIMFLDLVRDK